MQQKHIFFTLDNIFGEIFNKKFNRKIMDRYLIIDPTTRSKQKCLLL